VRSCSAIGHGARPEGVELVGDLRGDRRALVGPVLVADGQRGHRFDEPEAVGGLVKVLGRDVAGPEVRRLNVLGQRVGLVPADQVEVRLGLALPEDQQRRDLGQDVDHAVLLVDRRLRQTADHGSELADRVQAPRLEVAPRPHLSRIVERCHDRVEALQHHT
jgi:hypothetical protein